MIPADRRFRPRRGLSVVEMMVAVAIFAAVGIFVAFLALEIARISRTSIEMVPSELDAYRTVDAIRSELLPARSRNLFIDAMDSSVITFTNPARGLEAGAPVGGPRMQIWLDDNGAVLFNPNLADALATPRVLGRDIRDLRFEFAGDTRRIRVTVQTDGTVFTTTRQRDRVNTYSDVITLRN